MQPPFTMYNQWQSTFTIDSISLQSEASSIHYVQPLAKEFHNVFGQSQLRNNVDELPTSTGTACLQSSQSLSTPLQPRFTMCKQWHNTVTIDSSSLKCEASLIDYVQAVVKQFHNQSDQCHLRCNLHSLRTSTQALSKQFNDRFHQYQLQIKLDCLRTPTQALAKLFYY